MPSSRIESPIDCAISSTSAGSKDPPHASGVGKVAPFHAARPVRHSSCTRAGMPRRVSRCRRRCSPQSQAARSTGSTGGGPSAPGEWGGGGVFGVGEEVGGGGGGGGAGVDRRGACRRPWCSGRGRDG